MKQDWSKTFLMDIASVSTGKWDANHATENGEYRFYTCAYDYSYCDTKRFEGECLILPGNGVNVGEVFYYDGEFDAYQRTYVISDIKILPMFLHYHMQLHWRSLGTKKQYGSATNFIKIGNFKEYEVEYPPLPEQQRIVSILDEAFAAIDKAKANAEQNFKNAKELFESYLQGVFEKKGNGWEENKLSDVCSIGDGNYSSKYPKASEFIKAGVPFLTATNLKNGTVKPDGIRFISKEQHKTLTKGHITKGDLVIVVRGSSTGNNSIVPDEYEGSNLNSQLAYLRVKDNKLSSQYLFAVFNSPAVMKTVKAAISGAAQPQLPNNKLLDIKISYPSFSVQQTIVRQIETLQAETQKLESVYQKKIDDLEELKKSVLQKAFAGELKVSELGWVGLKDDKIKMNT
jgi:type I restriction enzyme S subunit